MKADMTRMLCDCGPQIAARPNRMLPSGRFHSWSVNAWPPGAGTGAGQGTSAFFNNSTGAIAGTYVDSNDVNHGFMWKW